LAHEESWEHRFQVSSLAATAAANGKHVGIAFFFAALRIWSTDRWSDFDPAATVDPTRIEGMGLPPLSDYLEDGRAAGLIHIYACSASIRLLGLDQAQVQERVDAIFGWQTISGLIDQAGSVVTL
jgi:predicted peroxiredoxin